jgi:hypothetical protein
MGDERKDILDLLDPLNIQTWYPEDRRGLFRALNAERCTRLVDSTRDRSGFLEEIRRTGYLVYERG